MAKLKNYYKILEIPAFADGDTIKAAYRKLARQFHPDVNPSHEEKFKLINEAYETLGSSNKKMLYDESLRVLLGRDTSSVQKTYKTEKPASPKTEPPKSDSTPINDLFENFIKKGFQSASDTDKGKKSTSSSPPPRAKSTAQRKPEQEPIFRTAKESAGSGTPKRGQDVTVDTIITPKEAEEGVVKTVHVQHNDVCKRCSGSGKVSGSVCSSCNGSKMLVRTKKIDVRVPSGVKQGSKVRVAGEGGRGQGNGENGDLFLSIKIEVDPSLRVEGMDVHSEMTITLPEAALGKEVQVPTLHGPVKLTIPPLTSSGKTLRLKEQGVHNGALKGDHFVTVRIVSPRHLSAEEKALYEQLARLQQD